MTAGFASFALANALVVATSVLVVAGARFRDALERALALVTVAFSQVAASLLLAGAALRRLEPVTILAINAAFLAAALIARRVMPGDALSAVRRRPELAAVWRFVTSTRWLAVLIALAVVEAVWRVVVAYVLPPSGFDALWYHLTTVAWWLQEGAIVRNPLNVWSTVYPANGELFFGWVAVFLRDDTFLDLVQLAFGIVGVLAVAGIARLAGLGRVAAAGAGLAFLLSPVVLAQTSATYVDLIFVSLFLLAVYWVLRSFMPAAASTEWDDLRSASHLRLLLAGLAGGLALGSKSTGVLYCGVLAALVAALLLTGARRRRLRLRFSLVAFMSFAVPLLLLGGFWYVRTWATYGSPFYPVRIAVGGVQLFDGQPLERFLTSPEYSDEWWKELLWQWHVDLVPFAGIRYFGVGSSTGGLGPVWSYLMLPALVVFAIGAARRRLPILLMLYAPIVVIFALQPYRWWSRFTIDLLAVGAIALFFVMEWLPQRLAGGVRWLVVLVAVAGMAYSTPTKSVLSRLAQPRDERSIGDVVAPWFRWVDDVPAGSRIAVDTTVPWVGAPPEIWFFYPLFGSRFENDVLPLAQGKRMPTLQRLSADDIDYVVVGARGRYVTWSQAAVRERCLRSVFADAHARVFHLAAGCARLRRQSRDVTG